MHDAVSRPVTGGISRPVTGGQSGSEIRPGSLPPHISSSLPQPPHHIASVPHAVSSAPDQIPPPPLDSSPSNPDNDKAPEAIIEREPNRCQHGFATIITVFCFCCPCSLLGMLYIIQAREDVHTDFLRLASQKRLRAWLCTFIGLLMGIGTIALIALFLKGTFAGLFEQTGLENIIKTYFKGPWSLLDPETNTTTATIT